MCECIFINRKCVCGDCRWTQSRRAMACIRRVKSRLPVNSLRSKTHTLLTIHLAILRRTPSSRRQVSTSAQVQAATNNNNPTHCLFTRFLRNDDMAVLMAPFLSPTDAQISFRHTHFFIIIFLNNIWTGKVCCLRVLSLIIRIIFFINAKDNRWIRNKIKE